MAFKITKKDQDRIDTLTAKLAEKKQEVDAAVDALNEVRDELRGVIEDIKDEMQGQYDDKSEKWQEGDRASTTTEWIDALGEIVSELETEIETIDLSDLTDKLEEGVPSEPAY